MAVLKQLVVTVLVLAIAGAIWLKLDEAPGRYLLTNDLGLPAPVMEVVSYLSAADDQQAVTEAAGTDAPPGSGQEAGAASAEAAGPIGGGRGRGEPTLVVTDPVTTSVTRNQLKAIGTGEAEQSVVVHPDATGIVESVAFSSGAEVEAGQILATLQNETEQLALDRGRIASAAAEQKLARYQQLVASRTITAVEAEEVQRELDNARLDVRASEIALANRNIVAPISGHVGIVGISIGDLVNNQTRIATIDDRSRLKIVFYVPEGFVPALSIGHPVEAVSVGSPGQVYRGEISAIDSRLDEASRTLKVEATIDNPRDELRPGMSFSLTMAFEGEEFLSVDPLAVQWERSGPYVWKVEGDEPSKAPIRIIERNVDRVLVAANDLQAGDPVVVEGLQSIREGTKVRAVPRNPAASPGDLVSEEEDAPEPAPQARRIGQRGASHTGSIAAEAAEPDLRAAREPTVSIEAAELRLQPQPQAVAPMPLISAGRAAEAAAPAQQPTRLTEPKSPTPAEAAALQRQPVSSTAPEPEPDETLTPVSALPVPTPRSSVIAEGEAQ